MTNPLVKDFIMRMCKAWRPTMTDKEKNDMLYNMSDEARDLLVLVLKEEPDMHEGFPDCTCDVNRKSQDCPHHGWENDEAREGKT